MWNGEGYVIAVDYNRYVIMKHCSLSKRKHVPYECFKCTYDKMNYIMRFAHSSELTTSFF